MLPSGRDSKRRPRKVTSAMASRGERTPARHAAVYSPALWPIIAPGAIPQDSRSLATAYSVGKSAGSVSPGDSRRSLAAAASEGPASRSARSVAPKRLVETGEALVDRLPVDGFARVELGPHPPVLRSAPREHEDDLGRLGLRLARHDALAVLSIERVGGVARRLARRWRDGMRTPFDPTAACRRRPRGRGPGARAGAPPGSGSPGRARRASGPTGPARGARPGCVAAGPLADDSGLDRGGRRLLHEDVSVGAPGAERGDPGDTALSGRIGPFPEALVHEEGTADELDLGIRTPVMQARRDLAMSQREHRLDEAAHAGGFARVTDVRLERADGAELRPVGRAPGTPRSAP